MNVHFRSGELELAAHIARPVGVPSPRRNPGLVLCHGFPAGPQGAAGAGTTYPQLADRLAAEIGWTVLAFNFRGTGSSPGDFSLAGWCDDLRAAVDHLLGTGEVNGVWLAGASTGGSVALCVAADDQRVRGVATLAAPADFDGWANDPRGLLAHLRAIGAIRTPGFPADPLVWARPFRECEPLAAIAAMAPRPVLIMQGDEDDVVAVADARALADAAPGNAELRIIHGAGHRLRHDPRAIALLLGWLERQHGGS